VVTIARLPKAKQEVRRHCLSAFIEVEKSMQRNTQALRTSLNTLLLLTIFTCLFFNPTPAFALGTDRAIPDFNEFSKAVQNDEAGVLRGVYVPDVFAFPIVQQPSGNAGYVSSTDGEITQFSMASQFGNVGLLAHNNLSGRFFSQLAVGQEVRLVYGNGRVEYFVIRQILQYQALQPNSTYSSFRDLNNEETLSVEQMFKRVYLGDRHVTFQTCIAGPGSLSWGRLFVIAEPKPKYSGFNHFELQ
jgi:hypothetical protein